MADAFRSADYGYVARPRTVRELADFRLESVAPLRANPPDAMIVYDTAWDPLHLLSRGPGAWVLKNFYGYEAPMTPQAIGRMLSMRVSRQWTHHGLSMCVLVRDRGAAPPVRASR